jgi:arsenate reductase-like glutaredoxin family protein
MYQVTMEPVAARTAYLASCPPTGSTEPVPFHGEVRQLGRVRVESKYLIYRLANMRTSVKQAEYVSEHGLEPTFFDSADENPSAQQAQHALLLDLSKVSNADIYSHLRDHPLQDRPIIVTASGTVVDGNRRLAAMRELYTSDPARYESFLYVEVAVLPDSASENDLVEMETIIQIRPNLQSDYGWIEEALGLEKQMQVLGWNLDKVSQLWHKTPEELQKKLETLAIARDYLEHIGKPEHFGEVDGSEQAITTFRDSTSTDSFRDLAPRMKQASRLVMYSVLQSTEIGRRKYDYAKKIKEITDRVILHLDPVPSTGTNETLDTSNPLGGLPADDTDIDAAFIELLEDPENSDEIASFAEESLLDIEQQAKAARKGNQLLQAATSAHSKLLEVQRVNLDPATYQRSATMLMNTVAESVGLIIFLLHEDPDLSASLDPMQLELAARLYRKLSKDKD